MTLLTGLLQQFRREADVILNVNKKICNNDLNIKVEENSFN